MNEPAPAAIRLVTLLPHDDIREAEREGLLAELVVQTGKQIQSELAVAIQQWVTANPLKAKPLKGGTE